MIDETVRIRRNERVAAHELGGNEGGVLLHLTSGQYHGLDRVGWAIWTLLDGAPSLPELAAALRAQFPDAPHELDRDVRTFVQDLLERDLAQIVPRAPGETMTP
jgi:hypothetical protein